MIAQQLLLAVLSLGASSVLAAQYPVIESWSGQNFFSGFELPSSTYDNTTNGDVFWATSQNTSLLYVSGSGTAILKVDNTSFVPYNEKRYAPKILSKSQYNLGTVIVLDAVHMPYGCSVWPAFWTQGPNWPNGGEIDIVENINLATTNQIALHTPGNQCTATATDSIMGTIALTNCSYAADYGSGCTTTTNNTATFGSGFAAAGGGVYVTEFASTGIKIWFYTRSAVPSSVTSSAKTIDTSSLGQPMAEYSSSTCDMTASFGPQRITIDTTLCGSFAGQANLLEETCPLTGTNTCYTQYVINDAQTTYQNAYWEINYVNVFSTAATNDSDTNAVNPSATFAGVSGAATGSGKAGPSSTGSSSSSSGKPSSAAQRRFAPAHASFGVGAGLLGATVTMAGMGVAMLL